MDNISSQQDAERFLRGLGLTVPEAVVRQVVDVVSGKVKSSFRRLWNGSRRDGVSSLCARGTVTKLRKHYREGRLDPYLAYLGAKSGIGLGCSCRPPSTPAEYLQGKAQDRHIEEVLEQLHKLRPLHLFSPGDSILRQDGLGIMTYQAALSQDAEERLGVAQSIHLSEEIAGHLKGTKAKEVLDAAVQEVTPYNRRRLALWQSIRTSLEKECGLPVRFLPFPFLGAAAPPCLHANLVDTVYQMLFEFAAGAKGLQPDQSWWLPIATPHGPPYLAFRLAAAAIGIPFDSTLVPQIQDGVARCVKDIFAQHESEARELERLRHDRLRHLVGVVAEAFQGIQEEEVRRGVCPACPYPESREGPAAEDGGAVKAEADGREGQL